MSDPHNLQRFVDAQAPVYHQVLDELRAGQKRSHWMWFVFPQVEGLGRSPTAQKYAIRAREEASAYLEHPVLGGRLRECVDVLLGLEGCTAAGIFGPVDALKLRSCLTLFATVADDADERYQAALDQYYDGEKDPATLSILQRD